MSNIDLNRGVTIRRHPTTGVQVFMYKDTPGVFLNAHGTEVAPEMAKSAGFNTDTLLKDKLKRERMAVAMSTIEAEFSSGPAMREVVRTQGGFQLVAVGLGRHKVLDPDGEELHSQPLTLEEGNLLLDQLTHTPPETPASKVTAIEAKLAPVDPGFGVVEPESEVIPDPPGRYDPKPATPVYPKPKLAHVIPTDKDKLAKVAKGKSKTK